MPRILAKTKRTPTRQVKLALSGYFSYITLDVLMNGGDEGNRSCLLRRTSISRFRLCGAKAFGHRSKTLPRSVFSLRSIPRFISSQKAIAPQSGCYCFLVEMRGIEPLSENLLIQLSPSAFRLLDFPSTHGGGQP